MKSKNKFLCILIALCLVPFYAKANDSKMFEDVPKNHWAYDTIKELVDKGIIDGYEGKASTQFKGDKTLTRYEFAQALLKAIQKIEAEVGVSKAKGAIEELNINDVLQKSNLSKDDIELLKKLIQEFQKELADMNLRVTDLEVKQRDMEVSQPKTPLYLSIGAAVISVIALIISIAK